MRGLLLFLILYLYIQYLTSHVFHQKISSVSLESFQGSNQSLLFGAGQRFHRFDARCRQRFVEFRQQPQSGSRWSSKRTWRRSSGQRSRAVPGAWPQVCRAGESPRVSSRSCGLRCPASACPSCRHSQDAQHVVLLQRNPMRLDDLRETTPQHVTGPVKRQDRLSCAGESNGFDCRISSRKPFVFRVECGCLTEK